MKIISSQRYTDESIVAEKIAAADFEVIISPVFVVDGENFTVVLDGHHSLAAAREAAVTPDYTTADVAMHDAIALLERGDVEGFLEATHMGDDYYEIETGACAW